MRWNELWDMPEPRNTVHWWDKEEEARPKGTEDGEQQSSPWEHALDEGDQKSTPVSFGEVLVHTVSILDESLSIDTAYADYPGL